MSWVKNLFTKNTDEPEKFASLEKRRASLSERSEKIYDEIGALEDREKRLVNNGKASSSKVTKRRLAQQISLLRKDIRMRNTSAVVLNKQINTIGTHLRNLELVQRGSVSGLPSCDELTEAAVNAEEIMEELTASDDLVNSIWNEIDFGLSAEEADILAEFEDEEESTENPSLDIDIKEERARMRQEVQFVGEDQPRPETIRDAEGLPINWSTMDFNKPVQT